MTRRRRVVGREKDVQTLGNNERDMTRIEIKENTVAINVVPSGSLENMLKIITI